jgi:hypothetical protein
MGFREGWIDGVQVVGDGRDVKGPRVGCCTVIRLGRSRWMRTGQLWEGQSVQHPLSSAVNLSLRKLDRRHFGSAAQRTSTTKEGGGKEKTSDWQEMAGHRILQLPMSKITVKRKSSPNRLGGQMLNTLHLRQMSSHGLSRMCIAVPQLEHSLSSDLSTCFNLPMKRSDWVKRLESLELSLSGEKVVRSVGLRQRLLAV